MKRILLAVWLASAVAGSSLGADAAVEERLNKITGQLEDLLAAKAEQDKRMSALIKEFEALRESAGKSGDSASQDELRKLAEKVQEIDRKREADKELILREIEKLGKTVARPPVRSPASDTAGGGAAARPEKGYEYVIQSGDTLSAVVAAYREQGIRVTVDQILKANPGLKPESLKVGQKVFIPAGGN